MVDEVQTAFNISERCVCRAIEQPRSSQHYTPQIPERDAPLTQRIIGLAVRYGRYGYRRITALLQAEGWWVNHMKVERIWRLEGLKVPQKQFKRGRLWLYDGSCVRLQPEHANHVWSYDFVMDTTDDGRPFRMLNVIDEFTRECLAIRVGRKLKTGDVQECLTDLFCSRGVPEHIRSDNGLAFTAKMIRSWLNELGQKPCLSSQAVPGKMATSRVSTANCVRVA